MAKLPVPAARSCEAALRSTADAILLRTSAIQVLPRKVRALELARLVLKGAPGFGGAELQDKEIRDALEMEGIGLATFKKALSAARKELVKKPRTSAAKGVPKRRVSAVVEPSSAGDLFAAPASGGSSIVENLSRDRL